MRLTIHIKKPFFITKEQKTKEIRTLTPVSQNSLTDNKKKEKVTVIKKPKKPKCIVNTLTFRDLRSMVEVNEQILNVRSKYGIKLKDKEEMVYVHPKSNTNIPKLCKTIQNYCDRQKEGYKL